MITIIISGTPGTGKTTISTFLSTKLGATLISLNKLIIDKNLTLSYDKERETHIADTDKCIEYLVEKINNLKTKGIPYLIIESNFSDIVPDEFIDYAIILRCHPKVLYNRLKERNYNEKKIKENIQAEILGECANFLIQKKLKRPVLEFDTSQEGLNDIVDKISAILNEKGTILEHKIGKIDWLGELDKKDQLNKYFD